MSNLEDDIIGADAILPIGLIKKLANVRRFVNKNRFILDVHNELRKLLKKVEFDTNPMLLCCENGVFDFEHCEFRDGRPEDYCSLSTKLIYKIPPQDEIDYLNNTLSTTFPNPTMKQQFIDIFSKCLIGQPLQNFSHGIFDINTKYGNGGVSTMQKFMSLTFGEYYNVIYYDMTIKQAISHCKNKRFIALKSDKNIKIGGIKQWLEDVRCPIWFQPRENDVAVQCLLDDTIRHGVFGIRKNYNIINFESKFIYPFEESKFDWTKIEKQNMYKADLLLLDKLTTLSQTMLWKLIDNFIRLKYDNDINLGSKPDIFTNTYDYCITKCGCSCCVHKYVKNNWTKISCFLRVNNYLIVEDLRLCIAKILVEL